MAPGSIRYVLHVVVFVKPVHSNIGQCIVNCQQVCALQYIACCTLLCRVSGVVARSSISASEQYVYVE
jgi:hypothetical protein